MRLEFGLWQGAAATALILCAGMFVELSFATAQHAPVATAAPATLPPVAMAARAVFDRFCASCHQADRSTSSTPHNTLRNILDVDAMAREPGFVLPGNPDGSRMVQMMMWRHLDPQPPDAKAATEPKPADIGAVRAWIKSLPRSEPCTVAERLDAGAIAALGAKAVAKAAAGQAKDMRFVSLAAPYNACARPQQLAQFRADVSQVLNSLSWSTRIVEPQAIDDNGALLAFSLADLGWTETHWETIVSASPYAGQWSWSKLQSLATVVGTRDPVVHGGWLVGALTSGALFEALVQLPPRDGGFTDRLGIDLAAARARRIARRTEMSAAPLQLVINYGHPLDLSRLAAEYAAGPDTVLAVSAALSPQLEVLARRAQQGVVLRQEVEDAFRLLATLPTGAATEPAGKFVRGISVTPTADATRPPRITLLAGKPVLQRGDAVTYTVTTDRDCHLTVINVDGLGRGTVMFPNELEPDDMIRAGNVMRLPSGDAGYELKARQPGTEALVALCNPQSSWIAGISHDFERQRFTVLGDYEAFVRRSLAPEPVVAVRQTRRRPRRRGKVEVPPLVRPVPGMIGRTGILVDVR